MKLKQHGQSFVSEIVPVLLSEEMVVAKDCLIRPDFIKIGNRVVLKPQPIPSVLVTRNGRKVRLPV